jgi:hypothetical protein
MVGISFLLLLSPAIIRQYFLKRRDIWYLTDSLISIYVLAFTAFAGLISPYFSFSLAWLPAAIGFACFLEAIIDFVKQNNFWQITGTILASLVFGMWVTGILGSFDSWFMTWTEGVVTGESLTGRQQMDISYHASVAQMLRVHGMPSTGLDGNPWMFYHTAHHWLMGQMANLLHIHLIDSYALCSFMITTVFFFRSFLSAVITIREWVVNKNSSVSKDNTLNYWFWLLFLVIFMKVIYGFYSGGMVGIMFFGVHVYTLSLGFFFICIATSVVYWQNRQTVSALENNLFLLVGLPLLLILTGLSSLAPVFIMAVLVAFLFFRLQLFRERIYWFSAVITGLAFIGVYLVTLETNFFGRHYTAEGEFNPLYFYKVGHDFKPFDFFVLYYIWIYVFTFLYLYKNDYFKNLKVAFKNLQTLPVEVILITALTGLLPSLFLLIGNTGAGYFLGVQMWVSGALLLAYLPTFSFSFKLPRLVISTGYVLISVGVFLLIYMNLRFEMNALFRDNLKTRKAITGVTDFNIEATDFLEKWIGGDYKSIQKNWETLYDAKILQHNLDTNAKYRFIKKIESLESLPLAEKKKSMLYVPYWKIPAFDVIVCQSKSTQLVAHSGLTLLDGMPPESCQTNVFGFEYYTRKPDKERVYTHAQLLQMAHEKGFEKVYVFEDSDKPFTVLK